MTFSTPSNFPNDLKPSDRLGAESAKNITDSIKSSSNSNSSSGFSTNSGSGSKSVGVNARSLQKPIWAVLTLKTSVLYSQEHWLPQTPAYLAARKNGMPLVGCKFSQKDSFGKVNLRTPLMVNAYSWYEVHDDLLIGRGVQGQSQMDGQIIVPTPLFPLQNPWYFEKCAALSTPSPSTNQGTVRRNPAYCINDNAISWDDLHGAYDYGTTGQTVVVDLATVVKLWYGSGDYMLFTCGRIQEWYKVGNENPYLPEEDHPN